MLDIRGVLLRSVHEKREKQSLKKGLRVYSHVSNDQRSCYSLHLRFELVLLLAFAASIFVAAIVFCLRYRIDGSISKKSVPHNPNYIYHQNLKLDRNVFEGDNHCRHPHGLSKRVA